MGRNNTSKMSKIILIYSIISIYRELSSKLKTLNILTWFEYKKNWLQNKTTLIALFSYYIIYSDNGTL